MNHPPKAESVVIYITPPGSAAFSVNMVSRDAYIGGAATCYGSITIDASATGPCGHDQALDITVHITQSDPTGFTPGTRLDIWINEALFVGWVEQDTVLPADRRGLWLHTLALTTVITIAEARKLGITRPIESAGVRWNNIGVAHEDIVPIYVSPQYVGGVEQDPDVAAVTDPTISLAEALRTLALARGMLVTGRNGWLRTVRLPEGAGVAWWAKYSEPSPLVTIRRDQLSAAPATTSRATHITEVELTYSASGAPASYTAGAATDFPIHLDMPTALEVTGTSADLDWLKGVATSITTGPTEPALGTTYLVNDFDDDGTSLLYLIAAARPLVCITPRPSHAGAYHMLDGYHLEVLPTLEIRLGLNLQPAGLYGLRPLRFTDTKATKRMTETYWPSPPPPGPVLPLPPDLEAPVQEFGTVPGIPTTLDALGAIRF